MVSSSQARRASLEGVFCWRPLDTLGLQIPKRLFLGAEIPKLRRYELGWFLGAPNTFLVLVFGGLPRYLASKNPANTKQKKPFEGVGLLGQTIF